MDISTTSKVWLHSIAAAAIGGSAAALGAVITAPDSFSWNTAGAVKLAQIAVIGAVVPVLALLKQSPLPGDSAPVDGANSLNLTK